jgi:hypothetical protein
MARSGSAITRSGFTITHSATSRPASASACNKIWQINKPGARVVPIPGLYFRLYPFPEFRDSIPKRHFRNFLGKSMDFQKTYF